MLEEGLGIALSQNARCYLVSTHLSLHPWWYNIYFHIQTGHFQLYPSVYYLLILMNIDVRFFEMFVTWLGACDRQATTAPCLSPINSSLLNRSRSYTGELLQSPSKWETKCMKYAGYVASVPEEGGQQTQVSIRRESSLNARTGTQITKSWDMSLEKQRNWRRCISGFHGCGIVSIEQVSAVIWRLHLTNLEVAC